MIPVLLDGHDTPAARCIWPRDIEKELDGVLVAVVRRHLAFAVRLPHRIVLREWVWPLLLAHLPSLYNVRSRIGADGQLVVVVV